MEASSFERAVYIYTNLSSLDLESRAPKSATVRLQAILLGRRGQRAAASLASEVRGKVAASRGEKRQSGRWGVVPASEHQEILVALASLIRPQRYEMALTILDNELGGGC